MKKLSGVIYVLFLMFFSQISPIFAADTEFDPDQYKEEIECFNILENKIGSDNRFFNSTSLGYTGGKKSLNGVLSSEVSNTRENYSTYEKFWNNRAINPLHRSEDGLTDQDFLLRRNHIGTIIASGSYVVSNIIGFGKDSNFDFPLSATGDDTPSYGDNYVLRDNASNPGYFREFLLYTHHSITGDFLSCGIVRIIPLSSRTFGSIDERYYYSNILDGKSPQAALGNRKCQSSFDGSYMNRQGTKKDLNYYVLKSNVCVIDYALEDFLKMEVISVAYDNKSNYANEYISHPYQVTAMSNPGNRSQGLFGIQQDFIKRLQDNTCLFIVHGNNLPERCQRIGFLQDTFFSGLWKKLSFIPQTYASRNFSFSDAEIKAAEGIVVYQNLSYELFEKLQSIPDETFQNALLLAIHPTYEGRIEYKKENKLELTPYEQVFTTCNMSYDERFANVKDFLEKYDASTFSYNNLQYLNPKFGDCIVPYPDKRNITQVIPFSFPSNQFLAQKLLGQYETVEVTDDMKIYAQKLNNIEVKRESQLANLFSKFENGDISQDEYLGEQVKIENTYKQDMSLLDTEQEASFQKVEGQIDEFLTEKSDYSVTKIIQILIALILIGIGGGLIFFLIPRIKKTS